LARQDLIGIALFNGGSQCTVPHGGTQGVFGTNPLAYAIPTDGDSICLDMATSEIPFFEVKNAKQDKIKLQPKAAVDSSGVPTTDPQKALSDDGVANLLPMGGGFKGYGIVMLIEVLTGSLVRSLLSTQQTPGWNPDEYGCLLIAIDIGTLTDLSEFKRSVSEMCAAIRKLPTAPGFESVGIPGERGHARLQAALQEGSIDINDEVYGALVNLLRNDK
jgi:ureidoglycolate dehydrogenase (NAD+)